VRWLAPAAAGFALLVGTAVLVGWLLDVPSLRAIFPGLAAMKANTAAGLLLSGAALWLIRPSPPLSRSVWLARLLAGAVTTLALLTLAEHALARDLGIDQLLVVESPARLVGSPPGRMAVAAGLGLLGVSSALLLLDARPPWVAHGLTLGVMALSFVGLVGYLYAAESVTRFGPYATMALPTAATLLVLAVGILSVRPARGVMRVITSPDAGGTVARRLLPFSIGVPLTIGWLRYQGERHGVLDTHMAVALAASLNVLVFVTVILWSSASLLKVDAEKRLAEGEVRRYARDLERSNRELENFAYVASHDLQEPLRTTASFAQLLASRYTGRLDRDADEFIAFIKGGAERMQALVSDLLAYSRVGAKDKPRGAVSGERVLQTVVEDLQSAIGQSGARLTRDPLPTVMADESQLAQVFRNLVENAIKYRRPDVPPQIHVGAAPQGGEWVFSVRDNGLGIEPRYFERIFVMFQRLHAGDEYPGTGIGLAVCKKVVERHGGRIWVKSRLGEGSSFHFTLPRAEEPAS
jgi:signal transduction histidine kinase